MSSFWPPYLKSLHVIETIYHCHPKTLQTQSSTWPTSAGCHFPLTLLSRFLSHFFPPAFRGSLMQFLSVRATQHGKFISSGHILVALIISHCRAIRVLITGSVRFKGDPSLSHMYITHANSAKHVNVTLLQRTIRRIFLSHSLCPAEATPFSCNDCVQLEELQKWTLFHVISLSNPIKNIPIRVSSD